MPKVFISYSHLDEQHASCLYFDLRKSGLDVWLDKESLLPGQDWKAEIEKAIQGSDFVVLLLSNNSVAKRGFFQKEVRLTLDVLQTIPFGHIYLLPIRIDECHVPAQLASIQYVDLFPYREHGLRKLIKSIEIQSGIQLNARIAEEAEEVSRARILLVNDEPATMNLVVDLWKGQGLKVDYAFDVPRAIKSIQESSPTVIVSDLSHYSFGNLVTDRAGFEILEWAKSHNLGVKVVITTSQLTEERRSEATLLGAVGICNNLNDLNNLLANATGVSIRIPEELSPANETEKSVETANVPIEGNTWRKP